MTRSRARGPGGGPLAGALVVLVAVWLGCAPPLQVRYEERLDRTEAGARHAVHSDRLEQLMRGLERLAQDRLPTAMDVDAEREFRVDEVASLLLALADSALRIPEASRSVALEADERVEFEQLAEALRGSALALADQAPRLPVGELRTRLEAVYQRCDACHTRFRELPGSSRP
jgi:cytochrome c556